MTLILDGNLQVSDGGLPAQIAGVAPTLDYRFAKDRNEIDAVSLTDKLTVTTVDADGTFFNQGGQLQQATSNTLRFDHSPETRLSQGLLLEGTSANQIRNSLGIGAVIGSPGTAPTNWSVNNFGSGVTRQLTNIGIEDGIPFVDYRWSGTTTIAVVGALLFRPEAANMVAAASGDTFTSSGYLRLVAGSLSPFDAIIFTCDERDSSGNFLARSETAILGLEASKLSSQRYSVTRTFSNALTAYAAQQIVITYKTLVAFDFTLRFGGAQLEKASTASSFIPTSTAAVTRSADDIKIAAGSGVITGTYTMVEKPAGCAAVSGTDILLNTGYTAERVMVFPASLSAGQITAIRSAM